MLKSANNCIMLYMKNNDKLYNTISLSKEKIENIIV